MSSKKQKKRSKKGQNYDPNPPRCSQCVYFEKSQQGRPAVFSKGSELYPEVKYKPSHCKYGNFAVSIYGICDRWKHAHTGETLEDEYVPEQCKIDPISSRACELGTRSCIVVHDVK